MPEAHAETVAERARRDLLGRACFLLHFAVMVFIVTGWAIPVRSLLIFYLILVPAVAAQWQCNRNTCVLNNLESLIRNGRWRDPTNPEEGAWLLMLVRNVLGLRLRPAHMDGFIYGVLVLLWGLAIGHILRL
jgi:hypothetical protein